MAYQFIKRWISWLTIANIAESVKKTDDFHPKSTISAFLFAAPDFIKPDDDINITLISSDICPEYSAQYTGFLL